MVNKMVIFNTNTLVVTELLTITNLDTDHKVRRMSLDEFPVLLKKYGANEDIALIVFDDQYIVLELLINNLKEYYKDDFDYS